MQYGVQRTRYAAPLTLSWGKQSFLPARKVLYNKTMSHTSSFTLKEIRAKLRAILPLLRERYGVHSLELFGSYVRGEAGAQSDLDLLVTFEAAPTLFQFIALEEYLSEVLGVKVDLVMKDSLKPRLRDLILAEAEEV